MAWLERCDISAISGNIFSQDVEGVAVPLECALNFSHDLGRQMLQRFGVQIAQRAREVLKTGHGGRFDLGSSISVELGLGGLPRHAILVAWWSESNRYNQRHVEHCVTSSLRESFRLGLRSLAVPLFGTGSVELHKEDLYSGITQALADLDALRTSDGFSVVELRFVSVRSEDVRLLQQHLQSLQRDIDSQNRPQSTASRGTGDQAGGMHLRAR